MKDKELIITPNHICLTEDPSKYVMMDWEDQLMKEHSLIVTKNGGDILEIGFGMGISASYIYGQNISSYTVVECHPVIAENAREWAKGKKNVTVIEGNWYDVKDEIKKKKYDGIFYDAFDDKNINKFILLVREIIKDGGIYSLFNPYGLDIPYYKNETKRKLIRVNPPPNHYFNEKECYITWVEDINNIVDIKIKNKNKFGENKILYNKNGIKVEDRNDLRILNIGEYPQLGYNYYKLKNEDEILESMCNFNREIDVLCIGLGGGRIPLKIIEKDIVKSLDVIEINPQMLEILEFFDTEKILKDKRVNIIFEDAFDFVKSSTKKYDFIVIDITNSPNKNNSEIFSETFFNDIKNNIFKEDSIGTYWYFTYFKELMENEVLKIISNIKKSFQNVSYHYITNPNPGSYFFFSNNFNWNKKTIKL